jgi:hypothetical protein
VAAAYAAFAAAATAANLGIQRLVDLAWGGPAGRLAALAAGTAVGLGVKFALDARFIFGYRPPGLREGAARFLAYAGTGALTTALFWGIELAASRLVRASWAPYAGGALGLVAGYALKYVLDRALVFRTGSGGPDLPRRRPAATLPACGRSSSSTPRISPPDTSGRGSSTPGGSTT